MGLDVVLEYAGSGHSLGSINLIDCVFQPIKHATRRQRQVANMVVWAGRLQCKVASLCQDTNASTCPWLVKVSLGHNGTDLTPNPSRGVHVEHAKRRPQDRWQPTQETCQAWDSLSALQDYNQNQPSYMTDAALVLAVSFYSQVDMCVGNCIACACLNTRISEELTQAFHVLRSFGRQVLSSCYKTELLIATAPLMAVSGAYYYGPHYQTVKMMISCCDKAALLELVRINGTLLRFSAKELRDDLDVVVAATNQSAEALKYASETLRDSYFVVKKAVRKQGNALEFASLRLRDCFNTVMAAVTNFGNALEFASSRLQSNFLIVSAAVKRSCRALQFASAAMKDNETIVCSACAKPYGCIALSIASKRLRSDPRVVRKAAMTNADVLWSAQCTVQELEDIAVDIVTTSPREFLKLRPSILESKRFVLTVIDKLSAKHLDIVVANLLPCWKNSAEVMSLVKKKNPGCFKHASVRLKELFESKNTAS